jgi:hypothetical protein
MQSVLKSRALRPLPTLANSAVVIKEIDSTGNLLPFEGLHDTKIRSKILQQAAPSQSISNDEAVTAPALFGPGLIPLKYQVPKSLHHRVQNHNGVSQRNALSWLHTSPLIQQSLECRQLVYTPRCFLGALITLGAIFLMVSVGQYFLSRYFATERVISAGGYCSCFEQK